MRLATLLVPHDGSWMADRALGCARMLQGVTGARLDLLRIVPDLGPGTHAHPGLTAVGADIWDGLSPSDPGTNIDDPVAAVLDAITLRRPDLVVLASDSWSSAGLGIDVARNIARRASVPLLVIPTGLEVVRSGHDLRRILVALDGSAQAEQALPPALVLAEALDADVLLLRVVPPKVVSSGGRADDDEIDLAAARHYVEDLAETLPTVRTRVSALAVVGEPGTMIAAVSRSQRASLLAMTTRGKGTMAYSDLGGIVISSLQSAGMPLLLVPPVAPVERGDRVSSISRQA